MPKRSNSKILPVAIELATTRPSLKTITKHGDLLIWLMDRLHDVGPPVRIGHEIAVRGQDLLQQVAAGRVHTPVALSVEIVAKSAWHVMEGGDRSHLCGKRKLDTLILMAELYKSPCAIDVQGMIDTAIKAWDDHKHFLRFKYDPKNRTTRIRSRGETESNFATKIDLKVEGLPWCCETHHDTY